MSFWRAPWREAAVLLGNGECMVARLLPGAEKQRDWGVSV